jgi:Golgi phosphoprotein 3 (GPP34)
MDGSPAVSLPEELLLLCADPDSGRVRRPAHLDRALGGAVLAELLLAGAISVDGKQITGVVPVAVDDVFTGRLLDDLVQAFRRGRRLRLDRWVRRASSGARLHVLTTLTDRALLTCERRRVLRLLPVTVYTAPDPGWGKWAALRIRDELSCPRDPRTAHLAALATTVDLDQRLFRGQPDARAIRRDLRKLVRATPIAHAVGEVISADSASSG